MTTDALGFLACLGVLTAIWLFHSWAARDRVRRIEAAMEDLRR